VSRYPDARRVVLELADLRRLTILERARACALAGIAESELAPLLRVVGSHESAPEDLERAALVLYAIAYQLERRIDPAVTWADAQTWDLGLNLEGPRDELAEAEARASVEAAVGTGLPPAVAGELTLAQLERYGELRAEQTRARRRPRARVHR
jgi:hypothetical protein